MTGLHARLGWPIWVCRALVEVTVLAIGWLLGGTVGIGTVLFAVLIGPLVHVALPLLDTRATGSSAPDARRAGRRADLAADQCSRNSGQSLPGVIRECSAFFATSIEGYAARRRIGARHRDGVPVVVLADAADDAGRAVGDPQGVVRLGGAHLELLPMPPDATPRAAACARACTASRDSSDGVDVDRVT